MWKFNHKESWVLKNWCFWTVVLKKTLESPLDCKEIQPVHPKGNQSWVFIGKTDAEAETPMLWAPDVKNWLMGEDPDSGKNWRQEEKGMIEDDMVGWHHDSMVMCLTKLWGVVMDMEAWDTAVHGVTKSHTWQSSWTELRDRVTKKKKKLEYSHQRVQIPTMSKQRAEELGDNYIGAALVGLGFSGLSW